MSQSDKPAAATITGEQLEVLTGLTDRRLRQLAKAGYYPAPTKGLYQQALTIRGLFKYYREDHHNTNRTLNDAKLTKLRADAEMAELKLAEAKRNVIGREAVSHYLRTWIARFDVLLTAEMEHNLPAILLGQPIEILRKELRDCHDRIREASKRGLVRFEDLNPSAEEDVIDAPEYVDDEG